MDFPLFDILAVQNVILLSIFNRILLFNLQKDDEMINCKSKKAKFQFLY